MFFTPQGAYILDEDDKGERTPKLRYGNEPEEKEPNQLIDTGDDVGACYLCNRKTNTKVVFSPVPPTSKYQTKVKPYRIRICVWCAVGHKIVEKPVT